VDTATIKSISTAYAGKTYSGSPITVTPTAAGTSDMMVTVTDSRGRTATTTKAIVVKAYNPPTIHVTASRYADAEGQTPDDTGAYAKVTITGTLDMVNVTDNSGAITLTWQDVDQAEAVQTKAYTVTDGAWTISQMIAASDTKAYAITAAIADKGSTRQAAMALSNGAVLVDFFAGGKGVCFGATATKKGFGVEMAPVYGKALLDYVHPVGSYYLSDNTTSPAELFGGTWEKLAEGTFLMSAGTNYPVGSTGGEATHVLSVDEMPSHSHNYGSTRQDADPDTSGAHGYKWSAINNSQTTTTSGGNKAHNNMPPYTATNIWQRIT
jgi:hypothetical protein